MKITFRNIELGINESTLWQHGNKGSASSWINHKNCAAGPYNLLRKKIKPSQLLFQSLLKHPD